MLCVHSQRGQSLWNGQSVGYTICYSLMAHYYHNTSTSLQFHFMFWLESCIRAKQANPIYTEPWSLYSRKIPYKIGNEKCYQEILENQNQRENQVDEQCQKN